jgi:hypothetical protein
MAKRSAKAAAKQLPAIDARMTVSVCPYMDGSGYRFTVEVAGTAEKDRVLIKQAGTLLLMGVEEWQQLRQAVDAAINVVMARETP